MKILVIASQADTDSLHGVAGTLRRWRASGLRVCQE